MANGKIAANVAIGGASGIVGGPIGVGVGAAIGYVTGSGVLGELFGSKKTVAPTPWYDVPQNWLYVAAGVGLLTLGYLAYRKSHG
jgi:hypothetical protein